MSQNKFCTACGTEIDVRAEICPKCGVRQEAPQRVVKKSPVLKIVLAIIAAIIVIPLLAGIAIPQYKAYKMKSYNTLAISDLRNARTSMEAYFADNQKYPDSLEQTGFKPSENVDIAIQKFSDKEYGIAATHKLGNIIYTANSNDSGIQQSSK